ncbi:MAG TPA: sensor histidine kinase [Marmoricola sp.]|nr:sensor histidine kinase [Marmoricola sp.]
MQWRVSAARVDRILAVVFALVWLLQVVVAGDQLEPDRYSMGIAGLVVCAGMWFRRDHALVVGLVVEAVMELTVNIGQLFVGPVTLAWWSALYALAAWTSDRAFVVGMVGFVAIDLTPDVVHGSFGNQNDGFTAIAVIVMLLIRLIVGSRDRQLRLAERERQVTAREAVVEERARIARELHDVVAHHVSTMVIQAGAERRSLGDEAQETSEVLGTIERVGRGALTEMRRMVAMLRSDPDEELSPQPTLAQVDELVAQLRDAGVHAELRVTGERRELPAGIELSAYRIVQEALTNVLKHAGGATAVVEISYQAHALEVVVRDDGRGSARNLAEGGHGLVGVRERATMLGGRFEAGRQPDGGFAVRVLLPVA